MSGSACVGFLTVAAVLNIAGLLHRPLLAADREQKPRCLVLSSKLNDTGRSFSIALMDPGEKAREIHVVFDGLNGEEYPRVVIPLAAGLSSRIDGMMPAGRYSAAAPRFVPDLWTELGASLEVRKKGSEWIIKLGLPHVSLQWEGYAISIAVGECGVLAFSAPDRMAAARASRNAQAAAAFTLEGAQAPLPWLAVVLQDREPDRALHILQQLSASADDRIRTWALREKVRVLLATGAAGKAEPIIEQLLQSGDTESVLTGATAQLRLVRRQTSRESEAVRTWREKIRNIHSPELRLYESAILMQGDDFQGAARILEELHERELSDKGVLQTTILVRLQALREFSGSPSDALSGALRLLAHPLIDAGSAWHLAGQVNRILASLKLVNQAAAYDQGLLLGALAREVDPSGQAAIPIACVMKMHDVNGHETLLERASRHREPLRARADALAYRCCGDPALLPLSHAVATAQTIAGDQFSPARLRHLAQRFLTGYSSVNASTEQLNAAAHDFLLMLSQASEPGK